MTPGLHQAVRMNLERFPEDFMFQLTSDEARGLRSQIVTLDGGGAAVTSTCRTHSPSRVSRCFRAGFEVREPCR